VSWWQIIASGPSLTRSDCDALRGIGPTIAVNKAVFYAPWADYLYAGDNSFWKVYGPDVAWFKGEKVTHQAYLNTRQFAGDYRFKRFGGNSGHQAIQYAVSQGARKIALIGFDHKHADDGRKHCHEDYPRQVRVGNETISFGNAECVEYWIKIMQSTAQDLDRMGAEVVNLSRDTALTCFRRMSVAEFSAMVL
jgi:hypothetical protein